jgi:hypothetical protein
MRALASYTLVLSFLFRQPVSLHWDTNGLGCTVVPGRRVCCP